MKKFFSDLQDDVSIDLASDWQDESKPMFFLMYGIIFLGFPIWLPIRLVVTLCKSDSIWIRLLPIVVLAYVAVTLYSGSYC